MQQEIPKPKQNNNRNLLTKYAGLAMQWLVIIFLAVWAGRKSDQWLKFKKPVFTWLLPVAGIIGLLYNVIRDTSSGQKK